MNPNMIPEKEGREEGQAPARSDSPSAHSLEDATNSDNSLQGYAAMNSVDEHSEIAEEAGSAETAVERAKRNSNQLRGTLTETLADPSATHFTGDDTVLLKFHGSYQQDDGDVRQHRGEPREKAYSFMIRVATWRGPQVY